MGCLRRDGTWQTVGRAVRGASHRRNAIPLQDAIRWFPTEGTGASITLALADGHGNPICFRSKRGAEMAVKVATGVLHDFYLQHPREEGPDLQPLAQGLIPRLLVERWRGSVVSHLHETPLEASELQNVAEKVGLAARRALEADNVLAYGSTVLAALATPAYLLLVQLGDGDCLLVSPSGKTTRPWPRDARLMGVETTSLCMPEAWKEVRLAVEPVADGSPALLLLCTDGYSNSFREEEGFMNVGRDFLELIRSEGIAWVNDRLDAWLAETTERGSGDDVSVGILWRQDTSSELPVGKNV